MSKRKDKLARLGTQKHGLGKASSSAEPFGGVSRRGWKVIGIGIGIVVCGFFVLSLTDPEGQNWASNLSPFLILGGYTVIGFGIVTKEVQEQNPKTDGVTIPTISK